MIRRAALLVVGMGIAFGATAQVPGLGTFTYDGSGNVTAVGTQTFDYDNLGRLKSATVGPNDTETYTYDRYGNLKTLTQNSVVRTYGVDSTTNRVSVTTAPVHATYDGRGNVLTTSAGDTFVPDGINVVKEATVDGTRRLYVYTASDERLASVMMANGVAVRWDWTVRDPSNRVLRRFSKTQSGTWSWEEDYIYRDGQLLAAEVASPEKVRHFHPDHLGTPRLITGNGGAEIAQHAYYPFGEEHPSTRLQDNEGLKFTGHERDTASLDYMHARYYNPAMGRFLSPDPGRDWDLRQPQSWNMYSYVRNNPINTVDPTGKWGWSDFKQWVGERSDALSNWWREKWHKDIPAPADQYGGVEALEAAGYSQAEAQELGNPQARWANARAEAGAIISDEASREIATQVAMSAIGGIVVKGLSREALMLRKALASEAQMAEAGQAIAGAGTRTALRDTPRLVATYGGEGADWVKMRSSSYTAADGVRFETHWYQHIRTGERVEFKTKF